jgi:hypothetical protein
MAVRPIVTEPTGTRPRRPRRDARYWTVELIPQYLIGAATLVFAATKWNAVRSAMDSMQAVALNTAIALGWLAFSLVLMPLLVKRQAVRVVVSSIVALVLAWVLFANAYRDKTVVETLRGLDAPTAAPVPAEQAEEIVPEAAAPTVPTTATTAPAAPVRLRSAELRGVGHRATGRASIIRTPDERLVVGLEDIDIEPGPDYHVYVVPGDTESTDAGAVELDTLRGNVGTQFYDVPDGVAVDDGTWTVLVWCKRFAVPVAAAVPA